MGGWVRWGWCRCRLCGLLSPSPVTVIKVGTTPEPIPILTTMVESRQSLPGQAIRYFYIGRLRHSALFSFAPPHSQRLRCRRRCIHTPPPPYSPLRLQFRIQFRRHFLIAPPIHRRLTHRPRDIRTRNRPRNRPTLASNRVCGRWAEGVAEGWARGESWEGGWGREVGRMGGNGDKKGAWQNRTRGIGIVWPYSSALQVVPRQIFF